jgi:ABC-type transport system involved in multi-copper enzyme maturation permease subunit
MLSRVAAVSLGTFRECVRDRLFYLVGVFGVVLVASAVLVSPLTVGGQAKIVADVGLAAMSLLGFLVVVLVGGHMVRKELDRHTLATVLARPLARGEYLAGKFAGLALTLLAMLVLMGGLYVAALTLASAPLGWSHLAAVYLVLLELLVMTAAAILLSVVASPVLGSVFVLGFFAIGHLAGSLQDFAAGAPTATVRLVGDVLRYVVPNLEVFNLRAEVVHGDPVALGYLGLVTLYAAAHVALFLLAAGAVFRRKDL